MIGQVVLCPHCMDRVFVSAKSIGAERSVVDSTSPAAPPPQGFAADVLSSVLARMRPQDGDNSSSMGLVVAALGLFSVLIIGAAVLIVVRGKLADENAEKNEMATSAKTLPVKADVRLPSFPPPAQRTPPPVVASPTPAAAAPVRAWTIRGSTVAPPYSPPQQQGGAATWPEVWRLPELASSADQPVSSLADLEPTLKVSLISTAADVGPPTSIALVPELETTAKLPAGATDPIASLRLEASDLLFSWAVLQRDPKLASQLANCLLEISDGKRKRVAQFRQPVQVEPISLDLMADKQTVEAEVPNLPRATSLQLEVTELIGFSSEPKLRGGARNTAAVLGGANPMIPGIPAGGIMPAGIGSGTGMTGFAPMAMPGVVTIEFPDISGLEIRIGFKQEGGKLALSIDPAFRDEGKDGELSLRRIAQMEEDARKPLANAQRDLDSAERSSKLWADKLKDSKANEPPPTSRRFAAWKLKHMEATRNSAMFEKGVADLTARIEKSKSRLELAAKLRAFLKESHKQATIHYVVYCECGENDLLLIDGRAR